MEPVPRRARRCRQRLLARAVGDVVSAVPLPRDLARLDVNLRDIEVAETVAWYPTEAE